MKSVVKLMRRGFEAAGAVQLLVQAGVAAVIAGSVGAIAEFPLVPRLFLIVGIFSLTLSAFLAYFGSQIQDIPEDELAPVRGAVETIAQTSGDHSPAASASHTGHGDVNIDQSTHHYVGNEKPLPFGGEPLVQKPIQELMAFYDLHTSLQADRLVEAFLGRPIRVTGILANVTDRNKDSLQMQLELGNKYGSAWFSGDWRSRLAEIDKMTKVSIVGRIKDLDSMGVSLADCELVDVYGPGQVDLGPDAVQG
jgi:hypothetical protein